jgi:hypothetical protein
MMVDARAGLGTGVASFTGLFHMRIHRTFVLLLVAALGPASAVAQGRGIMPGRGALGPGRGNGSFSRESGIQIPKYANGVNLLIEHRPELALSDSQFTNIVAMKRALDSTNAPLMRKLDSVQRLFKTGTPMFSSPSVARRDSISEGRALVSETLGTIRNNIVTWRDKACATLSSTQFAKARDLEERAERAASEENQASGGSEGRRGRPPAG